MIEVQITQNDIDKGVKGSNCACPIALAVGRKVGGLCRVTNTKLLVDRWTYTLPIEARTFICHFDNGTPVKPFTLRLNGELPCV